MTSTLGTWYPPALGTGGYLIKRQLFTNPPFHPMTQDINATLEERGNRYGDFMGHAEITMKLKNSIRASAALHGKALADDQQEALDMICHKIGRIINGDPDYADSWHDIAGYAQLVANRLNGVQAIRGSITLHNHQTNAYQKH